MTHTENVENALRTAKKPLTSREIADRIGANYNTVRGILPRLIKRGKVSRESTGLYKHSS